MEKWWAIHSGCQDRSAKGMNTQFNKINTMADKHMKKCSILLDVKEIQIQILVGTQWCTCSNASAWKNLKVWQFPGPCGSVD